MRRHKIISGIAILVILGAGYMAVHAATSTTGGTQYTLGMVTEGSLQQTVTGSGQVTANDTLNVSPKGSGQIETVNVKVGQHVTAGTVIARLDITDAANAVTSARQDLESAQISYQQAELSSQTGVSSDQTSAATAQTSLAASISASNTNTPPVVNGLNTALYSLSRVPGYEALTNLNAYSNYINTATAQQYSAQVATDYNKAKASYAQLQSQYASTDLNTASAAQLQQIALTTIATNQLLATTIHDTLTYLNYINDQVISGQKVAPPDLASQITSLTAYQTTITGNVSSLNSAITALQNAQQAIAKDTQSLSSSNTPLTVQSAQLAVARAQQALSTAEQNESDYIVVAPFDGTIATLPVHVYDQASAGTVVATLITNGNYVDLSLNEADISKIQLGQPTSLTFDAIEGLTATGTVAEVDPVGTVSQGVVTYTVKIGLNTTDTRVKPGMTADATITTSSVADAVQVPSAAVHTTGSDSYVEVATLKNASSTPGMPGMPAGIGSTTRMRTGSSTYSGAASSTRSFAGRSGTTGATARSLSLSADEVTITRVPVVIGVSNDTDVQIVSGLRPGQRIVTATTVGTGKNATARSGGLLSGLFGGSRRATGTTGTTRSTTGAAGATTGSRTYSGGVAGGSSGGFSGGPPGQ